MLYRSKFTPLALILVAGTLLAQETVGTAVGRITSKSGQPIVGALVRLASPGLLGDRTTATDDKGQFRIPLLPNGKYTITISAKDYITVKGQFQVVPGQTVRQDAAMVSTIEDQKQGTTVEVIGRAAQVDKTSSMTVSSYSMESLGQLTSQSLDSLVVLSPGITGTLDPNVGGYGSDAISIRGGIQHSSKVIQNGMNVTEEGGGYGNELTTLLDMVETMAVIQSPLNARYGNTDGGLVSIVTTRGSNTFTGTARVKYSKNFWQDNNPSYPRRDGSAGDVVNPNDDGANRTYELSLRGPIWQDHITFAYGTQQTPSHSYTSAVGGTTLSGLPSEATSTYVPGQGIVAANTYSLGSLDTLHDQAKFNQFVVFAQLTPDHSLEWSYTQNDSEAYWGIPRFGRIDSVTSSATDNFHHRLWNLGYKGTLSSSGVLEARIGHTYRTWPHPYSPDVPPIWVTYIPSAKNADGSGLVTSLLGGYTSGGVAYNTNGYNADRGDTTLNDSAVVNYSHVISHGEGSHLIDVGATYEKFDWAIQVGAAKNQYVVPGQDPQSGQYLVFNAATATLNDLDPLKGNTSVLLDGTVNPGNGAPGSDTHFSRDFPQGGLGLIPLWVSRTGAENGHLQKVSSAFYLNDLWTINNQHSVMLGLRYDMFKVHDNDSTFVTYGHVYPRFEYKWDIGGDQSRLVNVSYGQFQASSPGSLFLPMSKGRFGDQTVYYWSNGSATPHYVTYDQLLNKDNYTADSRTFAGDTFTVDKSWKNPVSNETTVGIRRTYANGGYWRVTGVYKNWSNLFDIFPGEVYTDPSGSPNFKRVLRNDPDSERTYKSLELEWMLPLHKRFVLNGNYTYARMMANTRFTLDNPDRTTSQLANFRDYYNSLFTRDQYEPSTLRTPEHNLNLFLMLDLSSGKATSNITLRGNFTSGKPEGRWITENIPAPTLPGYNDATHQNTGGLPKFLVLAADGGRMSNTNLATVGLKYNLEIPLWRTAKWFTNVDVSNIFNTKSRGPYGLDSTGQMDTVGQPSQYTGHGWRAADDLSTAGTGRMAGRLITLDTGLRF